MLDRPPIREARCRPLGPAATRRLLPPASGNLWRNARALGKRLPHRASVAPGYSSAAGVGVTMSQRVDSRGRRWVLMVACALLAGFGGGWLVSEAARPVVKLNPAVTYQRMTGWEATAQAGQLDTTRGGLSAAFVRYKDRLFDLAVNDLGINRLRVEMRSGSENPRDYFTEFLDGRMSYSEWKRHWYEKVNDNADPMVIDPRGFQFSEVDHVMDHIVVPIQHRLAARGERLSVVLT